MVAGPLQPAALAVIVVVPLHGAAKLTAPVDALIVFPPAMLAASREYVMPVELLAVVVYVSEPAPWHLVEVAGENGLTVTVGVIVTVWLVVAGPLHPAALAVMMEVPLQDAEYVTAPVDAMIVFPPERLAASREYVIPVELLAVVEYGTEPAP